MPSDRPPPAHENSGSLLRRLGWFVLLWLAGVGAVGLIAFLLRLWIA